MVAALEFVNRPNIRLVRGAVLAALLCSCASNDPQPVAHTRTEHPVTATAAVPPAAQHDDWRTLIPAPFGSTLQQVGMPLKEVILFQGDGRSAADASEQECYSKGGAPVLFQGTTVEDYVVCFFHEKLFRIEAALRLPADEPADVFDHWCGDWLKGIATLTRSEENCAGIDQDTTFVAKLSRDNDGAGSAITLVLYDAPAREIYENRLQERANTSATESKLPR